MRVIIDEVSPGASGIWTANIDPQRLMKLADPIHQGGSISVVFVARPSYDAGAHSLLFDLDSAVLLNLGKTSEVVFIDSRDKDVEQSPQRTEPPTRKESAGDRRFLDELKRLPESQQKLGEQLLAEVRKESPGELVFHQKSGEFAESPDNFWVMRIQPRAQSLQIVVYGNPREHVSTNTIKLKSDDMSNYSSFVIDGEYQISEAVEVILKAKRLKGLK